ncbi:hypothetical protein AN697_25380, partial [Enterobacter cloacae subsp. cloacae]|uniref:porin n=1 Tax=Enterobacter cloacae TaxID=550 RepID=UPI0006D979C4
MTSLKTSIKTITYLSDIGCLEIQGASLVLSLLVPALLVAGAANAAEIYNKDGNKLDLYGKVDGLHYFSDNDGQDGDQTYM